MGDVWAKGSTYEPYVGRWSRVVAREFLDWLEPSRGLRWLDVGCGTGALTETILDRAQPAEVVGIDLSPDYVAFAHDRLGARARFEIGDAQELPVIPEAFDAVVSGLALNFVPARARAVAEMVRVARPGAVVAAYVWDYAERMQMIRHFWDAAVALDPEAAKLDEGVRFPHCNPDSLAADWHGAGLQDVETRAIDAPTRFADFDDFWAPFLGGQGPAPGYVASRTEEDRTVLRERIRAALPVERDGSIALIARAWAVRGVKPRGP
jgi:SAM-dependent methyltransferase